MNIRGLKQASRQCLRDSQCGPWKLTLLFLLCMYVVTVTCDGITYWMSVRTLQASGLDVVTRSSQEALWAVTSSLVLSVLSWLWSAGYVAFTLRLSRGQTVSFGDFLTGFRLVGKVVAVMLLQSIYVFLWSMLLVIPGIIASYRYRMALYVILDDPELSASQAIRISCRLTYGHKLELFLLDLSFWWYILPMLATAALVQMYIFGYLPDTIQWQLGLYLLNLLVTAVMQATAMAYVQTTDAHAYNWLCSLDRARWEAARNPDMT